jgi:hypothetical protein
MSARAATRGATPWRSFVHLFEERCPDLIGRARTFTDPLESLLERDRRGPCRDAPSTGGLEAASGPHRAQGKALAAGGVHRLSAVQPPLREGAGQARRRRQDGRPRRLTRGPLSANPTGHRPPAPDGRRRGSNAPSPANPPPGGDGVLQPPRGSKARPRRGLATSSQSAAGLACCVRWRTVGGEADLRRYRQLDVDNDSRVAPVEAVGRTHPEVHPAEAHCAGA